MHGRSMRLLSELGGAPGQAAYPASAEDVPVSEELGAQVSDGEPGEDHLGARVRALLQLVVDDVPLRVHDRLVLRWVAQPNLQPAQKAAEVISVNLGAYDTVLEGCTEKKLQCLHCQQRAQRQLHTVSAHLAGH